ncbi:MAG: hypothetical protein MSS28_04020 [Tenericutes bacterium]|nr:hypothetical protein [Mycoplasmatota bacterium]
MLVLPIVNRNRILNVRVSLRNATKIRTDVELDDLLPSDIIVNGKSFNTSLFKDSKDKKTIIDFIRNNSILYKKNVLVTTKVRSNRNKYDVYEVLLPPRRVNDATDELYVRTILDMQKELPGTIRGKYVSLEELGLDEIFSDEKVSSLKQIIMSTPDSREWMELFRKQGLLELVDTLSFMRIFDCTVIGESSIAEDTIQQVLSSFEKVHSRDTKDLNKYYNMALGNRDVYAKMTYASKLLYGKPFDLIQSEAQKVRQFVKTEGDSRKSA